MKPKLGEIYAQVLAWIRSRSKQGIDEQVSLDDARTVIQATSPQPLEELRELIAGTMLMLFWLVPATYFNEELHRAELAREFDLAASLS